MTNKLRSEFIGKEIEVISSKNNNDEDVKGIVLDETLHTFKIFQNNSTKIIFKKNIIFKICGSERINGAEIEFKPEDRIKKVK